ncbi:NB-ARC domain-containing protein [Candidatus Halobeggiatoa sp. HSG11]|nr:NB-ARC domain-containing protein [Candidatus Halobeggiatoa sp. HSG11]
MDLKKLLDRQALQPQYVVDQNEKKTAVLVSLVKFNELYDKIAKVIQLAESLERTVTQLKKKGGVIEPVKTVASSGNMALIKQHYELLNKMLEDMREYQATDVVVKRKLMLQNVITTLEKEVQTHKSMLGEVKKQTKPAVLHDVTELSTDIIKASLLFNRVKKELLAKPIDGQKKSVIISAPSGAGKSVMATAIAHDEEVRLTFPDGIFWINLGNEADILSQQINLLKKLNKSVPNIFDIEEATKYLNKICETKSCLIILDDVCDSQDILAFNIVVEHSQILATTSENNMLEIIQYFISNVTNHDLTPLTEKQSIDFFMKSAKQGSTEVPVYLEDLVHACDYLPLTLKLVANVAHNIPTSEWSELIGRLGEEADFEFSDKYPQSLMQALHLNIEDLGEPADYYLALGVFADYSKIPQSVVLILWRYLYQLTNEEANNFIKELADKSLLKTDQKTLKLHSFQHEYLLSDTSEIEKLHVHLLAAYRRLCDQHGWLSGPNDGYFFEYLCMHLHHANRLNELKLLLLDFDWIQKKLNATSVYSLLNDYEWLEDETLDFVKKALYEAAAVLNIDKNDLATQLLDRLWEVKALKNNKDIQALLNQAKEVAPNWQWQPRFPDEKQKT